MKTFYLFDIDGTLVYSDKRDSRTFADTYTAVFSRPFPTIDWTRFPEVTDHVIFRTAFRDHFDRYPSEAERLHFEEQYSGALTQVRREDEGAGYPAVPGALNYWRRLEAEPSAVLGIATGGWRRPQSVKLAHVGLPADPPYAGFADGMDSRRAILQTAIDLAREDHDIGRIVYFGDAVWDVHTCRAMGIPLVGVRRRGDHETLTTLGLEQVVTDFADLDLVEAKVAEALAAG